LPGISTSGLLDGLADGAADWTMTSSDTSTDLTRRLGRRSWVVLNASIGRSERRIVGESGHQRELGVRVGRSLGQNQAVQTGYAVRQGRQRFRQAGRTIESHDFQAGIDRQWRHSARRQTAFTFEGGPSLVHERPFAVQDVTARPELEIESPAPEPPAEPRDRRALSQVAATVAMSHDVTDRWTIRSSYRRGTSLRQLGLFVNVATLDIRGAVGHRLDLVVSGGYSDGEIGVITGDERYETWSAVARLRVAISRSLALYGQYSSYHYDFSGQITRPVASPAQLKRRGLGVGLTVSLPLIGGSS
jgi:hypothetical protein